MEVKGRAMKYLLAILLIILFRRWLTLAMIFIFEILFILIAAGGPIPQSTWGGWVTCPKEFIVDPYGEKCIQATRGPTIVMSTLPSAGGGAPVYPDSVVYVNSGVNQSTTVNNSTNNYVVVGPGQAINRGLR